MIDPLAKASRAAQILESDEWKEAFQAYKDRIFEEIEKAPSDAVERVLHLKRLLSAANGAKSHLERLVSEGKIAADSIDFEEKRRKLSLLGKLGY